MSKKINIIDIAVILLVIAALAGFIVRFGTSATDSVNSQLKFRYTIQIENIREFTVDALNKKGVVTDTKSQLNVGEIVGDIEVKNAKSVASLSDGSIVSAEMPEKYTCLVTIEATGRESDDKYILADTTELAVGRTTELTTKYVQTSGIIKSVEIIE